MGVIMPECDAWSSGSHLVISREAGPLRAAWKMEETWASVDVTAALSQLALGCCTLGLFSCRRRISLLFKPFAAGSSVPCSCKHSKSSTGFPLLHFLLQRLVQARTKPLHSGRSSITHSLPTHLEQSLMRLAAHYITMLHSTARKRARSVFKTGQ